MKHRFVLALCLLLVAGGVAVRLSVRERTDGRGKEPSAPAMEPDPGPGASGLKEDLSSEFLEGYGDAAGDPSGDLVLVQDVLDAFLYTIKVPGALPTGGNREIMQALQGDNPYRIRFLDPDSPHLGDSGELLDRWGNPLYFHFVEAGEPGIRSAGPDGKMWTTDDVVQGDHVNEAR